MKLRRLVKILLLSIFLITTLYCTIINKQHCPLRTPDRRGYLLFNKNEYKTAADLFHNPMWQGAALYRDGEFKKAASVFSGFNTAEGIYNYGNALLMQGLYKDAIESYNHVLAMKPDWNDAEVNLAIARVRAAKTKKEGGNMTDGELGADDFIFTNNKTDGDNSWEEPDIGDKPSDDAAMRAIWLRQVQTKPADFLKAKFSYQNVKEDASK